MLSFVIALILGVLYALFGLWCFLDPQSALHSIGVPVVGPAARFEFRATYGALNLGIGFALVSGAFGTKSFREFALMMVAWLNAFYLLGRAHVVMRQGLPLPVFQAVIIVESFLFLSAVLALWALKGPLWLSFFQKKH